MGLNHLIEHFALILDLPFGNTFLNFRAIKFVYVFTYYFPHCLYK